MGLTTEQTDIAGLRVCDGPELIAEIRSLRLVFARFRPGGVPFLGGEVPLPLFWMQYANHEDPERNAGSNARLRVLHSDAESTSVECSGSTASGACASLMSLTISRSARPVRYRYRIHARLEVVAARGWIVTPNPDHGELEFANLWPEGTFVKDPTRKKFFQACVVAGRNGAARIPHHHLVSQDKHNIPLAPGDRFFWGVEDENPCLLFEAGREVSAGVCAYMWDAHFAFKIASGESPVVISHGESFEARYSLFGMDRPEAESLYAAARDRPAPERGPVYVEGVNRFSETLDTPGLEMGSAWPWEREASEGTELTVDRTRGFDDTFSLRIRMSRKGRSAWKATAFGPDYAKAPFPDGARFRLTARVMSRALHGKAGIAVGIHRAGNGSVFQPETYEMFESPRVLTGSADWQQLEVITPPVSPAPDRLHLLLTQEGEGESWFDNVLLEVL